MQLAGTFTVSRGRLYFIKTANRESGQIEVFRADPPDYSSIEVSTASALSALDAGNGLFIVD